MSYVIFVKLKKTVFTYLSKLYFEELTLMIAMVATPMRTSILILMLRRNVWRIQKIFFYFISLFFPPFIEFLKDEIEAEIMQEADMDLLRGIFSIWAFQRGYLRTVLPFFIHTCLKSIIKMSQLTMTKMMGTNQGNLIFKNTIRSTFFLELRSFVNLVCQLLLSKIDSGQLFIWSHVRIVQL